jgi:hypothetical protein
VSARAGIPWEGIARVGRALCGFAVASALATLAWIFVLQEGLERGITRYDYVRGLGEVAGTIPEDASRTGFALTFALMAGVATLLVACIEVAGRRTWRFALWFSIVPFVLWGAVLAPLTGARSEAIPGGAFGVDGGWATPLVGAAGSVVVAILLWRVYTLMSGRAWWRVTTSRPEGVLFVPPTAAPERADSLELAEQRAEQGGEAPGR